MLRNLSAGHAFNTELFEICNLALIQTSCLISTLKSSKSDTIQQSSFHNMNNKIGNNLQHQLNQTFITP